MTTKFLVVDDDKYLAEVLKELFSRAYHGAEVRVALDNDGAFRQMERYVPSLITTDINRPGGDGYEFLTRVRKDPMLRHIPVIAVSGANKSDDVQLRQYRHGFNAVLSKPFPLQELLSKIDEVLHLRSNPDAAMIHAGFESRDRDYKEFIDLTTKSGRAALAKDVIAFANYGGGTIILGVSEPSPGHFLPIGVPDSLVAKFESTHLNQAIRPFIDPPIHVTVRAVQDGIRTFIFIEIPPAKRTLLLAGKKNEAAGLYPGRIYTRTTDVSSAETQSSAELREVLSRFLQSTMKKANKSLPTSG